jgi:hypothetical protein
LGEFVGKILGNVIGVGEIQADAVACRIDKARPRVFLVAAGGLSDVKLVILDGGPHQSLPDLHHVGPQPLAGVVGVIGGGGGGGKVGVEARHGAPRRAVGRADGRDLPGGPVQLRQGLDQSPLSGRVVRGRLIEDGDVVVVVVRDQP